MRRLAGTSPWAGETASSQRRNAASRAGSAQVTAADGAKDGCGGALMDNPFYKSSPAVRPAPSVHMPSIPSKAPRARFALTPTALVACVLLHGGAAWAQDAVVLKPSAPLREHL